MTTLDFSQIQLDHLVTHHIGNKSRDEKYFLSEEETTLREDTRDLLLKYFFTSLKTEELYSFTHPLQLEQNDVFTVAEKIFASQKKFIPHTHSIARLLYEQTMHPKIEEGELNIAYFSNAAFNGTRVHAIGIFKSETDTPFLKMKIGKTNFDINHAYGFEITSIDKGCIIFNTDQSNGYKILIIDNSNKSSEAQYWKDHFLQVKPIANEFHQTNQFLSITKNFVTQQMEEEFDVTKTDKIDLLNRSVEYFKKRESFDKQEFEKEVFQDPGLIKSFRHFDNTYRQDHDLELEDSFDISAMAVKKQARVFKSVLKLDKNFHIYIHGDRSLIEQGEDGDGRKYYKIYFNEEK